MRTVLAILLAVALAGCAVFEQTPEDVKNKLADPTQGQLYQRNPLARD